MAGFDLASALFLLSCLPLLRRKAGQMRAAALQNDAVTLRYALDAETAAGRALSLAGMQYKLGGVSYLSVLNAQQVYQTAVITLVRARAARYADTVALFQALGGGWWNRDDLPPAPPGLLSSPLP